MRRSKYAIAFRCAFIIIAASLVGSAEGQVGSITRMIEEPEVQLYAKWLRLDEDQAALLIAFHDQYKSKLWDKNHPLREPELLLEIRAYHREMDAVLNRMVGGGGQRARWDLAPDLVPDLERKRMALQERVDLHEEAFFQQIESILTDEQLLFMVRVHLGRKRAIHTRYQVDLPEAKVDLIALIDALPFSKEEYNRIEREFILDFEPRYVAALERSKAAAWKSGGELWKTADIGERLSEARKQLPRGEQAIIEFNEASKPLREEAGRIAKRTARPRLAATEALVAINKVGLQQLSDLLPEDSAMLVARRYLEVAYPTVYPNASSMEPLYESALTLDDLTPDQREPIAALLQQYRITHQRLSKRMAEAVTDRMWFGFSLRADRGGMNEIRDRLLKAGREREALNERQPALLEPILTAEQVGRMAELDSQENPRIENPRIALPRPWDYEYERARKRKADDDERARKRQAERDAETEDDDDDGS